MDHTACTCISKSTKKGKSSIDDRFRSYLIKSNIDILFISILLAIYHGHEAVHAATDEQHNTSDTEHDVESSEETEVNAVLFPWFTEIVGVFVYYFLSRYAHAIPYTAIMFLIGALIGTSVGRLDNEIAKSAETWTGIEGEVILLVFLPGLLFLDSYNIDIHLFISSFTQILTFAFPMVLAGTTLTALVACYLFDYQWSFDLSMTFGSILAATDPVAVSVLLNELGAPPRLKMHISGESLMNDGSAVVFYHIFSLRFFYEMGTGLGEDVNWGQGFLLFFRLSLGGACIGLAFGVGLLVILYNLNRRLSGEDSVVQVVATIAAAYLSFFTSEILAKCSGIIAVLFCGVVTKAFGETYYNDPHLSLHFWEITEYLLNTLLFALGGCVWGDIISTKSYGDDTMLVFNGKDWGYLFMLFIFVVLIRFFLVFSFYPCTSRIGIGQNIREAIFMSYGGLRGAVGIALALSLHAEVIHLTSSDDFDLMTRIQYREYTAKLFGLVGGIAFLTLILLAPTSGPLLKKLGLITPTLTRQKVVENYRQHMMQYVLKEYVTLLTEKRFHDVDFTVVRDHIPFFANLNYEQLMTAVKHHKDISPRLSYTRPNLQNVIPYLYQPPGSITDVKDGTDDVDDTKRSSQRPFRRSDLLTSRRASVRDIRKSHGNRATVFDMRATYDEKDVHEERLVFIKILRSSYMKLIEHGQIEARGFIIHTLGLSLEFAEDAASRGLPLNDWNALEVASDSWARPAESMVSHLLRFFNRLKRKKYRVDFDLDFLVINFKVRQILSFIHAHQLARNIFKKEFAKAKGHLTEAEKIVLDESDEQVELAEEALKKLSETDVAIVKSHYVCQILLNRAAYYFTKLNKNGLMTSREAGHFLENIEESIHHVLECREVCHTDEMSKANKMKRISLAPKAVLESWIPQDVLSKDTYFKHHLSLGDDNEDHSTANEAMLPHISEGPDADGEEQEPSFTSERERGSLQDAEMPL